MTETIFITGGSRGIGEAVVRAAAGKYNVAFCYNQSESRALELEKELACKGVKAFKCDVSNRTSVQAAVDGAKARFGKIDVLVNCAGIATSGLFQDISEQDWRHTFGVNTDGVFYVTQAVIGDMISRGSGAVINVTSMWGLTGASMETAYSASKAAVIGLTKALAKEVAPSGVRVNAVAPGAVDTDMMKCYSKADIDALCEEIPLGRIGNACEIADAVLYLAQAQYVTGEILNINGGLVI